MQIFEYRPGTVPLMLSIPHAGTWMPEELRLQLSPEGRAIVDTDWYLPRLYDFDELSPASMIVANVSRYAIDLNRSIDDVNLYPGQKTTGLCPLVTFRGEPLYVRDAPDRREIDKRIETWWRPYHERLEAELSRLTERFGFAVLLDAHSIASQVPRLFEGRLPDFNFGTNQGRSCSPSLQHDINAFSSAMEDYTSVVNERFIGGYITRHYGSQKNVQAVQLELSQATYMTEAELSWNEVLANRVQPVLRRFVAMLLDWVGRQ